MSDKSWIDAAHWDYLDFELEIGPGTGADYPVAARSPAGDAHGSMHFPYGELARDSRLKDLTIALPKSGSTHRGMQTPEQQAVEDFGRELFDALVAGEVRSRYDVCRGGPDSPRRWRLQERRFWPIMKAPLGKNPYL